MEIIFKKLTPGLFVFIAITTSPLAGDMTTSRRGALTKVGVFVINFWSVSVSRAKYQKVTSVKLHGIGLGRRGNG